MNRKSFLATLFAAPLALVGVKAMPPAKPRCFSNRMSRSFNPPQWLDSLPSQERLEVLEICKDNSEKACQRRTLLKADA